MQYFIHFCKHTDYRITIMCLRVWGSNDAHEFEVCQFRYTLYGLITNHGPSTGESNFNWYWHNHVLIIGIDPIHRIVWTCETCSATIEIDGMVAVPPPTANSTGTVLQRFTVICRELRIVVIDRHRIGSLAGVSTDVQSVVICGTTNNECGILRIIPRSIVILKIEAYRTAALWQIV